MIKAANPYLVFNGTCGPAFDLYRSVFGGEFTARMTFGAAPGADGETCDGLEVKEGEEDKIMHVSLPLGVSILMGSDCPSSQPPVAMGSNIAVAVNVESREEADRVYAGLSDGGQPLMPMADTFWGAYFGFCVDKFGVYWQVHFDERTGSKE